jgi:hypothetical protein
LGRLSAAFFFADRWQHSRHAKQFFVDSKLALIHTESLDSQLNPPLPP